MNSSVASVVVGVIPILLIANLILTIILFSKHKKIMEKYEVGYWGSFFFAAYMLSPILLILFGSGAQGEDRILSIVMPIVYPLVAMAIFMYIYRGKPLRYKVGKFFAMLAIGICAAYLVVFKMLCFFHNFESARDATSSGNRINGRSITNADGSSGGYVTENGQIYGPDGAYKGYINESGQIYDDDMKNVGCINANGEIKGAFGESAGHINANGEIYDSMGRSIGHIN